MQFSLFSHQYWIAEAIELAKNSNINEVPVAALIVCDNNLIAGAVNRVQEHHDATSHAEILAIKEASRVLGNWRLNNCTLYTTLEPCPMCAGAILNSRISKIVFGAYDLNYGVYGSKINLLKLLERENQVEIIGGILEFECSNLLKDFFLVRR